MSDGDATDGGTVLFYWRPGCPFCGMLERNLARVGLPFEKRNIWEDPEHAAVVRSHADGNETVPTVVVRGDGGETAMVNPSADQVVAAVAVHAPALVPDGWEPPAPGPLGRALGRLFDR